MIGKTKFVFSDVRGRLGAIDRTIGREGGLSVNFRMSRHSVELVSKKAMTRGGSEARHERSRVYCDCDQEYKTLYETKTDYLNIYYRAAHNLTSWPYSEYMTWMKLCLAARLEKAAFVEFSYFSRYLIANIEGVDWLDKIVRLVNIPVKREDGKDVQIFKLDIDNNILEEIPHKVDAAGSALMKVTMTASGQWFFCDVYSYSDYQHLEADITVPVSDPILVQNAAFVNSDYPDWNYGNDLGMMVWLRPTFEFESFMELPFSGVGAVKLYIFWVFDYAPNQFMNISKTSVFDENTLTWNNKPPQGDLLALNVPIPPSETWSEIPLSDPGKYIMFRQAGIGWFEPPVFRSDDSGYGQPYILISAVPPPTFSPVWNKQIGPR